MQIKNIALFMLFLIGTGCMNTNDSMLKSKVNALANERGPVDLGVMRPVQTKLVRYIISQKRNSEKLLLAALHSEHLIKLGYAAYCLDEMNSDIGIVLAKKRLQNIKSSKNLTGEQRFAILCLSEYIERN